MKKFFNIFFVTLGVIFLIQILCLTYFYLADPLNLKPLFLGETPERSKVVEDNEGVNSSAVTDKHPLLNDSQESALESMGIDPANVPTEITTEQEACFETAIGKARVEEIKAGDAPTAIELFKARSCL
ncbi:hypothetical protein KC851_02840 [Candidatus Kaiserbacteria bacterium]|nr:hypothetical protein [Candidatus Kaiserbacteria bacterium]